jgi:hypothetical protein
MENLRKLSELATKAPWHHSVDDEEPGSEITDDNGSVVAFIQPHGNIRTIYSHQETFSHADARLIVELRNNVNSIIEEHEELLKWRRLFENLIGEKCSPEKAEEKFVELIQKLQLKMVNVNEGFTADYWQNLKRVLENSPSVPRLEVGKDEPEPFL